MKTSYNWLKDYISGKVPTPEKVAELLMFHSFEIEGLERRGEDWVLDVDVLPNRAHDCLSHIGIAREVAVLSNNSLKMPKVEFKEDKKKKASDFVEVLVENQKDCPRYTAVVIEGVKVKESPRWMQEKLEACGLQAINNIVDATNYVMLETGQPIHAFDSDKLGNKIVVRRARKGEKLSALDDKTYQLDKDILVVANNKEPVAIAGIKGGASTGIDDKTKNVLIEAGNWNPVLTRLTSKKLKLKTDASWRFENGVDPNLIDFAQQRVCSLIQQVAGGKVAKGMVDYYPKKLLPKKVRIDLGYVESLLGVGIPRKNIEEILKKLGFIVQSSVSKLQVEVPTRRLDISIPEDLIEEIGRVYGYQNILSVFPRAVLISPQRNNELFWENNIKNVLKESNFSEAYNYSFVGKKEKEIFNWQEKELVEIANPVSSFNRYLRPSLLPHLLRALKENINNFEEIKMFEVGQIFLQKKGDGAKRKARGATAKGAGKQGVKEKKMLAGVFTKKGIKDEGFYELKGIVDTLLNKLGISDVWYDEAQPTPEQSKLGHWHPGKRAEIKVGSKEIGFLGQVHPLLVDKLGIKQNVFLFEMDFEQLLEEVSEEHEYQPISSYPTSLRDLAILVPQGTRVVEVLNRINEAGGKLVRDVDLFDVYSGEAVPEGKENFAFHIIYQAEDKTLSSREIDKVHQKIVGALEEMPDWEVRK